METKTKAEAEGRAAPETQATKDRRDREGMAPGRITLIDVAEALMRRCCGQALQTF